MNEKTNKMMKRAGDLLMTTAIATISSKITRPLLQTGVDSVICKLQYTVSISSHLELFAYGLKKILPSYTDTVVLTEGVKRNIALVPHFNDANYTTVIMYKGTPITLKMEKVGMKTRTGGVVSMGTAKLSVPNTSRNRAKLVDFINQLMELSSHEKIIHDREKGYNLIQIQRDTGYGSRVYKNFQKVKLRTFHDVFIPHEQRELLQDSIRAYVANHDWYIENNLPNHFGILLYSEAGHGKSSIAQAIADYVGAQLYVASGDLIDKIGEIISEIDRHPLDASVYRVLLFEDVDSGLFNLNRENRDVGPFDGAPVGLATILNYLDGLNAPSNIIYVFTTNHVEYLDPAFIRPGRCDLHLKIEGVIPETLQQFLDFHYPKENVSLPDGYEVKDGLTFAELQTHVMKGESASDIIKFAQKN